MTGVLTLAIDIGVKPANMSGARRQRPPMAIDRYNRQRKLPRGFLLRGFSDACLRAPLRARVWQASENP